MNDYAMFLNFKIQIFKFHFFTQKTHPDIQTIFFYR